MSTFNWPTVPFSGTEVDAFVVEFKALAQSIYDDWDDDTSIYGDDGLILYDNLQDLGPIWKLKAPFRNKEDLKILLENSLIYAAFIVKQRAGNSGPGTDFDLGNSPYNPPTDAGERGLFIGDLGCIYTKEGMECAYQKNNPGRSGPPPLDGFPGLPGGGGSGGGGGGGGNGGGGGGGGGGNGGGNGGGGDGDGGNKSSIQNDVDPDAKDEFEDDENDPENCPDLSLRERAAVTLGHVHRGSFTPVKAALLEQYLSCDGSQFTADDLGSYKDALKNNIQDIFDKTSDGQVQSYLNGSATIRENITSSFTAEQLARLGLNSGDQIHSVNFYTSWGKNRGLHTLFGKGLVITNSSGEVIGVRDDFDFLYGNEAVRPDASYIGQENPSKQDGLYFRQHQRDSSNNPVPIGDPTAKDGTIYEGVTDVSDVQGTDGLSPSNIGRNIVATNFLHGNKKGAPVPVFIDF